MRNFKQLLEDYETEVTFDDLYDEAATDGKVKLPFECDAVLVVPQTELDDSEEKINIYADAIEKLAKKHDLVAIAVSDELEALKDLEDVLDDTTDIKNIKVTKGKTPAVEDSMVDFIVVANDKGKPCLSKHFK